MPLAALILIETSSAGNLGAAIRVAANFAVPALHLVRPQVAVDDPEVASWACGGGSHLEIRCFDTIAEAAAGVRTLVATASGRGRENHPLVTPAEAVAEISRRGPSATALVFGNETSGLRREELDTCDLVVRIPTAAEFPVLNLTQSVAVMLATLSLGLEPPDPVAPAPAPTVAVDQLMEHLREALLEVGFLDPTNPERMLRKLRRLFGRAGVTDNEVTILRGICRQVLWVARRRSSF